jgi:hypothetical protein
MEFVRPITPSEKVLVATAGEALTLEELVRATGMPLGSVAGAVNALHGRRRITRSWTPTGARWRATATGLEMVRRHEADGFGPNELNALRLPQ